MGNIELVDIDGMTLHKMVKKLIGNINPVGEIHTDNARFENLIVMTELVDALLTDIDMVTANNLNRQEFSRKRAGEFASKFFDQIGIVE